MLFLIAFHLKYSVSRYHACSLSFCLLVFQTLILDSLSKNIFGKDDSYPDRDVISYNAHDDALKQNSMLAQNQSFDSCQNCLTKSKVFF